MPARLARRMKFFSACFVTGILAIGFVGVKLWITPDVSAVWLWLLAGLLVCLLVLAFLAIECVSSCLYRPLERIVNWAAEIRQGNLSARIASGEGADELSGPVDDINRAAEWLEALALDKEQQLVSQKSDIERKSRSLQLLYDVATGINNATEVEQLTARFMYTVADVVGARAASARIKGVDGLSRPVAELNLEGILLFAERAAATHPELFNIHAELRVQDLIEVLQQQGENVPDELFGLELMVVPLQYLDQVKGVYLLFVENNRMAPSDEVRQLLISIGRQLGMAVEKARMDFEAHLVPRMQERAMLANELHDSLAQTLASLRFQVRVLDDTLHQGDESAVWAEMERVESSLEEANTELRELIRHFRAPVHRRGLIPAISAAVSRFRKETRTVTFFQDQWFEIELPEESEVHVLRIVQEALANVRKHSGADNVRVLLSRSSGRHRVLIEDDGEGFDEDRDGQTLDDHFGMSIMQERAAQIGGELRIESEAGEGTRIMLEFDPSHPIEPENEEQADK